MRNIRVNLGERSYKMLIGSGAIDSFSRLIGSMKFSGPAVLITDKIVASKLKTRIKSLQRQLPADCCSIIVPASERSKSLKV
jgi:3-dehydroquinate synthase